MIERNVEPLDVWPADWRSELEAEVHYAYTDIGTDRFQERFLYFKRREESIIPGGILLERHPIEYGFYLLTQQPGGVDPYLLPPGFFSWAYAFARLYRKTFQRPLASLKHDIATAINNSFGPPEHDTEERTLTPVFSHMRLFDYLSRINRGYDILPGTEVGITADVGFRYGTEVIGMDVKCFLQGWSNSMKDGLLVDLLQNSEALQHFGRTKSGYVLITVPHFNFLGKKRTPERSTAIDRFEHDLMEAIEDNWQPGISCLEFVKVGREGPLQPDQIRSIIDSNLLPGHSKKILYPRKISDIGSPEDRSKFVCIYYKNDLEAFENNFIRVSEKAIRQAGQNNKAFLAADLNFLSGWKVRSSEEAKSFAKLIEDTQTNLIRIVKSSPKSAALNSILICYDLPILSEPALRSVQPRTKISFLPSQDAGFPRVFRKSMMAQKFYDW